MTYELPKDKHSAMGSPRQQGTDAFTRDEVFIHMVPDQEQFTQSSRILPPDVSTASFATGSLTDISEYPTTALDLSHFGAGAYADPSQYPTSVLDISGFPTAPLSDISEWPTQPNLRAFGGTQLTAGTAAGRSAQVVPNWVLPVVGAPATAGRSTGSHRSIAAGAEGYLALVRNLAKSSGIYALAAVGAPLVSLVLAPFLTRYLSPAEYGILAILNTIVTLTAGVSQLGMSSAFFRAYSYDYTSPTERRHVLATVVVLLCLVSIPIALGVDLTSGWLASLLFGSPALGRLIALAAGVVLLQNLTIPGFSWLRAENRAMFFSVLSLANLLVSLVANIVLVGVLRLGIAGSLIAAASGYASVVVCTLPLVLWRGGLRVRADVAWSLLTFGAPLAVNFVSYWVLQLSDRYLLSLFRSTSVTATYAVAYSLGMVLSTLVITPFTLAWPATMYTIAKRRDAPHIFKLVFRWFSMLLLFTAFALSLVATTLLTWLFPASYRSAAPIIPIIAESIALYGVYYVFMIGANVQRKTWLAAVFTTVAALANVGLNLILIPRYGALGAATSTLIAYGVLAFAAYIVNQRLYPIPFEIARFVNAILAGIALYIWSQVAERWWGTQWAWLIGLLSVGIYGAWLVLLGQGIDYLRARRYHAA